MKTAIITLSHRGYQTSRRIMAGLGNGSDLFVPEQLGIDEEGSKKFHDGLLTLTTELFEVYEGLVFVLPTGAATRAVAPHVKGKKVDPAVVVVDVVGRYAISLLSGHEGGANDLALDVANILHADAVITTSTEAEKEIIVGVGCRKGISRDAVVDAVRQALEELELDVGDVRLMATVDIKAGEAGLLQAALELGVPLKIVSSEEIKNCVKDYSKDKFVQDSVGLWGVCEPVALLAGRKTQLIMRKKKYPGVTVAVAREFFIW